MKKLIKKEIDLRKQALFISIMIIFIGLLIIAYFLFIYSKSCNNYECFRKSLNECERTIFTKEDSNAVWRYSIENSIKTDSCKVEVTLLALKKGDITIEHIQGKSMMCNVMISASNYPEDDISSCTGELKEEIQEIIIQKMHNYLIKNIDKINEEFKVI